MEAYEELEIIGSGAFGRVSKIKRKNDNKILVWKELNYGSMNDQEKQQLVAEVNILRELRNPFIVRYYDRIVDKKTTRLYIVMEYCAGGDLGKVIKKCKRDRTNLDESIIWRIFSQIVIALKDCHRRIENGECKPILHRDLKPANILLDQDENLKIGDFGLAKELNGESKLARTNVGTPFYMSPEIVNGQKYDERSDIWAVGCLLYELASLRPPFDAQNQLSLAMKITAGRFHRIPNKYSDDLQNAIRSMLQVDPLKRPRIEDLMNLSAIQPALRHSNLLVKELHLAQSYSSKWRELKTRETALNEREEQLRNFEAQLNYREKSLINRENRLLQNEKINIKRTHSLPSHIEKETTIQIEDADCENNRRMSLQIENYEVDSKQNQQQQQQQQHQQNHQQQDGTHLNTFSIYSDDINNRQNDNKGKGNEDFISGVVRAKELLNRPRLMSVETHDKNKGLVQNTENSIHYYPSNANGFNGIQGGTFYKNYLTNKKLNGVGTGTENINPSRFNKINNGDGFRKAPKAPTYNNENTEQPGSATKRTRHEYEESQQLEVPSVQVDLQTLITAGKGKFESL